MASLAEFEKDVIRERAMAGLSAARKRGRVGGRPKGLSAERISKAKTAKRLYKQNVPVKEILESLNISRASLYRYLKIDD